MHCNHAHALRLTLDNVDKRRLQGSTADQEAINVLLLAQVVAILLAHAATIDDARLLGHLGRDLVCQPVPDLRVHLLRLLRRGHFARANGPDGLVGNDDAGPVGRGNGSLDGLELPRHNGNRLAGLALLETLATAKDDADAALERRLGLGRYQSVALLKYRASLRVAQDRPVDLAVLEVRNGYLARVRAIGLVKDVLRRHAHRRGNLFLGEEQVDGWWSNNDLYKPMSALIC